MMVLTFVLSQCFIVKLLTKPILLRIFDNDVKTIETTFVNAGYSKRFISQIVNTFLKDPARR